MRAGSTSLVPDLDIVAGPARAGCAQGSLGFASGSGLAGPLEMGCGNAGAFAEAAAAFGEAPALVALG